MIRPDELEQLSCDLYVYDVLQHGWEQEPDGHVLNMTHVLKHLSKSLSTKDFTDPITIESEIAPDSVQYAIRLVRWTLNSPLDLLTPCPTQPEQVSQVATNLGNVSIHFAAYSHATGTIARNLHDLDHNSSRADSILHRPIDMLNAGKLLMYSAKTQAQEYDFNLVDAFYARLASLRQRACIPEPIA